MNHLKEFNTFIFALAVTMLGYFGNRLVMSVDELNKNVAVLISRADSFDNRLSKLEMGR